MSGPFRKVSQILKDFANLRTPSKGPEAEKKKFNDYMRRAALTRFDGGVEKRNPDFELDFKTALKQVFDQRKPMEVYDIGNHFEVVNDFDQEERPYLCLRYDVFMAAKSHLEPSSSPGYPLQKNYSTNADVPDDQLFYYVNAAMLSLLSDERPDLMTPYELESLRIFFPATVFPKSEPTKVSKDLRLIYGDSVIKQMISLILMGDYLNEIKLGWTTCSHKVGMDMYTQSGLAKLAQHWSNQFHKWSLAPRQILSDILELTNECYNVEFPSDVEDGDTDDEEEESSDDSDVSSISLSPRERFDKLKEHFGDPDPEFVSDDIEGWEYQGRAWQQELWYENMVPPNATDYQRSMITRLGMLERNQSLLFSDGTLSQPLFFIILSGLRITHIFNSDIRAALARVDAFLKATDAMESTNGDDCIMPYIKQPELDYGDQYTYPQFRSSELGWVHTDVNPVWYECTSEDVAADTAQFTTLVPFSSQVFHITSTIMPRLGLQSPVIVDRVRCYPTGVHKMLYNYCCLGHGPYDEAARVAIRDHFQRRFHIDGDKLLKVCDIVDAQVSRMMRESA